MADATITQVNTGIDTFGTWIVKYNETANVIATTAVTANAAANGALTTGNAFVNGTVASVTLATGTLRGGNVQASATLNVSSNVVSNAILVGDVVVATTALRGGNVGTANVLLVSSNVSVGNSTANVVVTYSTISVGANVVANATALSVGNSIANVVATSVLVQVANASGSANLQPTQLVIGSSTVNSTAQAVGANVIANTTAVFVGNSIANSIVSATIVQVANSLATTNVTSSGLTVGSAIVNSTTVTVGSASMNSTSVSVGGAIVSSSRVAVGANVVVGNTGVSVGNSTVNVVVNSTSTYVSGVPVATTSTRAAVAEDGLLIGTRGRTNFTQGSGVSLSVVDDSANDQVTVQISGTPTLADGAGGANTDVLFNDSGSIGGSPALAFNKLTSTLFMGANVSVNAAAVSVGNSSIVTFVNSSIVQVSSATSQANVTASGLVVGNTVVNSTTIRVGGATVITGNIAFTGDATGTGSTSVTLTIGAGKVTNAMLAGSIAATKLVGTDITTVGTITSGTWNGTAINLSSYASGTLPAARLPALSGDVTTPTGSTVTTIGAGKVTNAMLAGSIAATKLVGTDITTVGTITSGTWSAGAVTSSGEVSASTQLRVTATSDSYLLRADATNFYILHANTTTGTWDAARPFTINTASNGVRVSVIEAGVWNGTAINLSSYASGTLQAAQFPALDGDVTTSAGDLTTTIGAGRVTNAMLAGSITAAKLVGTDITTVGTITSGTWNATDVPVSAGGTGSSTAAGARTNLGLATVANTGAYSSLSGLPTLGTAAALDVGTTASKVVQLNGSAQLPAVDGSLLTGISTGIPIPTSSALPVGFAMTVIVPGSVPNGTTVAGSSINSVYLVYVPQTGGGDTPVTPAYWAPVPGSTLPGTWKNISGGTISSNTGGLFVRVS